MTEAVRDNNKIPVLLGVLSSDGATPTMPKATPSTHALDSSDATTGSDVGSDNAARDNNGVTVMLALSETDGSTPVPLFINSSGELLIDSN